MSTLWQSLRDPLLINSLGLGLDIAGAAFLARYGLPNAKALDALLHEGRGVVVYSEPGKRAQAAAHARTIVRRHQLGGRTWLALLILGFALPLLSNAMQRLDWPALVVSTVQVRKIHRASATMIKPGDSSIVIIGG